MNDKAKKKMLNYLPNIGKAKEMKKVRHKHIGMRY